MESFDLFGAGDNAFARTMLTSSSSKRWLAFRGLRIGSAALLSLATLSDSRNLSNTVGGPLSVRAVAEILLMYARDDGGRP
jgi:hypothetical protein